MPLGWLPSGRSLSVLPGVKKDPDEKRVRVLLRSAEAAGFEPARGFILNPLSRRAH